MVATVETASTNFAIMVPRFYEKRLIEGLYPKTFLYKYADKYTVPLNSGATVYFQKYTEDTKAAGTLTEGTVPTITELSASGANVTLKQRGVAKRVTDMVDMVAINPVVTSAVDQVLIPKAAITVDKEILWRLTGSSELFSYEALDAAGNTTTSAIHLTQVLDGQNSGLSTLYLSVDGRKFVTTSARLYSYLSAAGLAAMADYVEDNKMSAPIIAAAVRELDTNNAITGEGGLYDGFAHPRVLFNLKRDPDFIQWFSPTSSNKGETGVVGTFGGVRWWQTTQMPVGTTGLTAGSMSTATFSYGLSLICGKGAFGVTELAGQGGVQMIVKKPGEGDTSNPLNQYSTIGFKITMGAVALNKSCAYFLLTPVV
jgi:N4-gp56 family major capsid protein